MIKRKPILCTDYVPRRARHKGEALLKYIACLIGVVALLAVAPAHEAAAKPAPVQKQDKAQGPAQKQGPAQGQAPAQGQTPQPAGPPAPPRPVPPPPEQVPIGPA